LFDEKNREVSREMPPRSVCLNVFTTSLGNDIGIRKEHEVDVEVREVEDKMEGVEHVMERARHDSVQGSPNGRLYSALSIRRLLLSRRLYLQLA
jgi:hypothetical protein